MRIRLIVALLVVLAAWLWWRGSEGSRDAASDRALLLNNTVPASVKGQGRLNVRASGSVEGIEATSATVLCRVVSGPADRLRPGLPVLMVAPGTSDRMLGGHIERLEHDGGSILIRVTADDGAHELAPGVRVDASVDVNAMPDPGKS